MIEYLNPTEVIDSDHPDIIDFAKSNSCESDSKIDQAVSLYYVVRDEIRYNPYRLNLTPEGMSASTTLQDKEGWCVTKATLLAALCRVVGIPSRLGFADVRNHLSTERLRQAMETDIFHWHGYASLYLKHRWVKATPAFNKELCEKFQIGTLEFNGREDSLYHPFDLNGQKHMEYILDRGEYADLPLEKVKNGLIEKYPKLVQAALAEFDNDVEREIAES